MTIKTLEERVGMTRANIRFYEEQGFLSPARLENGYRDYSDADAGTLRKIKLFRRLHLDLDTIRKLQGGEMTLTQALADQLAALERDQTALDRARQVCAELKDAGADWSSLDPKPWLEKLEKAPVPVSPRYAPPVDIAPPPDSTLYPWRRYYARQIDLTLCGLLWAAVSLLGFHWWPPREQPALLFWQFFDGYVGWALLFLFEPLLLHLWGTTPGKALFAISVRDADGNKLSWKHALRRTWGVFSKGYGYGVPIYEYWRLWKNYKACQNGERNEDWEGYLRPDRSFVWESYRVADGRGWRCVACAGAYALRLALIVLIALQSLLPPNRGPLTEAEFYENCNFYIDYLTPGNRHLDREGKLIDAQVPTGGAVVQVGGSIDTEFSVTLTDGAVTGVTVTRRAETTSSLWVYNTYQQVALLALAGSRPEVNALNFYRLAGDAGSFFQETEWNYDRALSFASGLPEPEVRQETLLEHFEHASPTFPLLTAERGETARFEQTFTVTVAP